MRKKKATRKLDPIEGHFGIEGTDLPVRHGTLSYSPTSGIRLRTYNRFKSDADDFTAGEAKYETIHGLVEDGAHVKLYNCKGHELVRRPGTAHTIYNAEFLVYGYCKLGLNEKRITSVTGRFRHLRKWLDLPGYKSEFISVGDESERRYRHSLISEPKDLPLLFSNEALIIQIGMKLFQPMGRVDFKKHTVTETAQVIFKHADPVDIPAVAKTMEMFERFLGFVTQANMPVTGVSLRIEKPELSDPTNKRQQYDRNALHPMYHFRYPNMARSMLTHGYQFLYPFNLIKTEFQEAYAKWLHIYDDLHPALDQFFAHRYDQNGYEATKHAYYSFIFEGVHKKLKRERKGKGLGGRYAEVLGEFLGYSQFFSQERIDEYKKKLVDARNLIAHQGELSKNSPINFDNIIQYNQLNQMLITYMVLSACGIDQSVLLERLTSEDQFTYFQWANAQM